jgi:hypothetical protein
MKPNSKFSLVLTVTLMGICFYGVARADFGFNIAAGIPISAATYKLKCIPTAPATTGDSFNITVNFAKAIPMDEVSGTSSASIEISSTNRTAKMSSIGPQKKIGTGVNTTFNSVTAPTPLSALLPIAKFTSTSGLRYHNGIVSINRAINSQFNSIVLAFNGAKYSDSAVGGILKIEKFLPEENLSLIFSYDCK